jgi:hypothetical protein
LAALREQYRSEQFTDELTSFNLPSSDAAVNNTVIPNPTMPATEEEEKTIDYS